MNKTKSILDRGKELASYGDQFHAHLDVCKRCESSPFDLCPAGRRLIHLAAGWTEEQVKKMEGGQP